LVMHVALVRTRRLLVELARLLQDS
jgi:hypothetical protein